jgi:hypothetical protein
MLNCCKGMAQVTSGRGVFIIFWQDMWNGRTLSQSYPQLFSHANNQSISLFSVFEISELEDLFYLP